MNKAEFIKMINELEINEINSFEINYINYDTDWEEEKLSYKT